MCDESVVNQLFFQCEAAPGGALTLAIRPEEITVGPAALHGDNRLTARITVVQFLGAFTRLGLTVDGEALECDVAATAFAALGVGEGADLPIALAPDALRAFPASGPAK